MEVIVIGYNHHNTLGLIRSLGEAGHHVHLLLMESGFNYVNKSSYLQSWKLLHNLNEVIPAVQDIAGRCKEKPVLFCSGDGEASFVNNHFIELNQYCYTEGAYKNGDVNIYHGKFKSNALAQAHGFKIPKTWVVNKFSALPDDLKYPLLVKAGDSIRGGKSVLRKYTNKDSLSDALHKVSEDLYPLQIQEFIEKEFEIIILGCSIDHGTQVLCPVAEKKLRYYPQEFQTTAYTESIQIEGNSDLEIIVDKIASMIRYVGYSGLFSVELIYANNQYYFLETNFRNDGTGYLATICGFNLPDIFCKSIIGERVNINGYQYQPCHYVNVIADGMNVIHRRVPLMQWIKQLKRAKCYSHYSKKDRKPLLYSVLALFINKF